LGSGIYIYMQRQAESFCRKHRQQGGVTAASITQKMGSGSAGSVAVGCLWLAPGCLSLQHPVCYCSQLLLLLLSVGLADSTASCGPTAIGPRCGGATARRASAAARVADLTRQTTMTLTAACAAEAVVKMGCRVVLYARARQADCPAMCCLPAGTMTDLTCDRPGVWKLLRCWAGKLLFVQLRSAVLCARVFVCEPRTPLYFITRSYPVPASLSLGVSHRPCPTSPQQWRCASTHSLGALLSTHMVPLMVSCFHRYPTHPKQRLPGPAVCASRHPNPDLCRLQSTCHCYVSSADQALPARILQAAPVSPAVRLSLLRQQRRPGPPACACTHPPSCTCVACNAPASS
jgi:hypothetical protein